MNCSAISAGLVESELFGHVRGAFTGAVAARRGRFEIADGGTLFLDEVGELPLETQVKLLRVLQEREIEPVGSSESRPVDVRVIAATNRDLEQEVAAGRFRADLYYRLNVFPIVMPPLRERDGDVALLAGFFADRFGRELGRRVEAIAPEALERLRAYGWPGNVRELSNVIERAVVLARGPVLDVSPELLPGAARRRSAAHVEPAASRAAGEPAASRAAGPAAFRAAGPAASRAAGQTLEELQRRHIEEALERSGWVIEGPRGAAAALGLRASTLRSRIKKLGVRRPREAAG